MELSKFPSLESMKIWEMYILETFVLEEGDCPHLQSLSINKCPLLRNIPRFRSLVQLSIHYCTQLPQIPDLPSPQSLNIYQCPKLDAYNWKSKNFVHYEHSRVPEKEEEWRSWDESVINEATKNTQVERCYDNYNLRKRTNEKVIRTNKLMDEKERSTKDYMDQQSRKVGPKPQTKVFGLVPMLEQSTKEIFIRENWSSLETAKKDLQALYSDVYNKVSNETWKLRDAKSVVHLWLSRAEVIIKDETLDKEREKLTSCSFNLTLRRKLGKQIIKRLQDVNKLLEDGKQLTDVGVDLLDGPGYVIPVAKTFGMDPMLEQLRKYFEDNERSIIGVWGPGGVGKTTLLSVFHNQLMDGSNFHMVILIDVSNSETFNVKDVQHTIIDRLGLPWVDTETEEVRARLLMKALSIKQFVILLDDVQKEFELKDIGIPLPTSGNRSKIILASRDQDVCIKMGAQHSLIKMQLLNHQVSWDLFFSNLSTKSQHSIKSNEAIKWRAEAISRSCQGLPLALNVTSRAVAALGTPQEWRDAAATISMGLGEIGGGDEIFQRLKYSYEQLNDSTTKECFLYCTLFPESSSIRKVQLVDYWIAEGLIPENRRWKGTFIIKKLISACLLQETNSRQKVRMHNIIHQFGQWLAKKESNFLVQSGKKLTSAPEIEEWNGPKRISLMSNDITDLSFSPNCSNLATLFLQNNSRLKRMAPRFFRYMRNLKVLDLSNTAINELPDCDALGQLQFLNLSQTPIRKLPKRFWVLKELRYLDLSLTDSLEETHDNCSKLLKLRVLNLFRSHYGIRDVSDLNLDRLKELNSLGITICTEDVLRKLKKTHPLAKSTNRLSLTDCPNMESIHVTDFNHMVHLQELYIESCPNLSELVMDQDDGAVSSLQVFTLQELPNLDTILAKSLPHSFTRLRELTIYKCHKLKNIDWVARLESLDKLVVSQCNGMGHIIVESESRRDGMSEEEEIQPVDEDVVGTNEFPKLRSIVLSNLENLVRICNPRKFPYLESIRVQGCPKLVTLPIIHEHDIAKLRQICGSSEWWNRLGWDDINTRRDLEKYFIAI